MISSENFPGYSITKVRDNPKPVDMHPLTLTQGARRPREQDKCGTSSCSDNDFWSDRELSPHARDIVVIDIDGDIDSDVLVANADGVHNELWINDNMGALAPIPWDATEGEDSRGLAVVDIDNDGDADVRPTVHRHKQRTFVSFHPRRVD